MTVLATARLTLRPARASDLAALHEVFSAPAAMRYWSHPEHETLAQTQDTLDALLSTPTEFVLIHQGQVIGKAGAWREWEVGYILHPRFWGQGLMHEAMLALVPHLFATTPAPALTAECDPRNAGSLSLLARLGFHETGRARRTMQWRDEWCDSVYLRCDRACDNHGT